MCFSASCLKYRIIFMKREQVHHKCQNKKEGDHLSKCLSYPISDARQVMREEIVKCLLQAGTVYTSYSK